jgi:hypothetical protein
MFKEFRSIGVFAAFSRWSADISFMPLGIHRIPFDVNAQMSELLYCRTPTLLKQAKRAKTK